ncbi:MAG: FG-GAP repeat protein, partial [Planctomycetota bacterium]
AIVGAPHNDDAGYASGSAYLFDFSDPCSIIETKLTASDAAGDNGFGFSVAINGTTAIVGSPGTDFASGSAYLYDFSDPCNPVEIAKLTASDAAGGDLFGHSVAISGTTALVGAAGTGTDSGSAYLFGPCPYTIAGDINEDCRVDLRDFAVMAGNWLVDCILEPSDPACLAP